MYIIYNLFNFIRMYIGMLFILFSTDRIAHMRVVFLLYKRSNFRSFDTWADI